MVWYAEFGTSWYSMVQKALDILVEYGGKPSLGHLSTAKTWPTLVSAILRLGGCSTGETLVQNSYQILIEFLLHKNILRDRGEVAKLGGTLVQDSKSWKTKVFPFHLIKLYKFYITL